VGTVVVDDDTSVEWQDTIRTAGVDLIVADGAAHKNN
jgi:hypothetical protein